MIGTPVTGVWSLQIVDSDVDPRGLPVRALEGWSLSFTHQSTDRWRFTKDLVIEGTVESDSACRITPYQREDGTIVNGVITLTCGSNPPIQLSTFQCGNGSIDPGETCDDGNLVADDGCDERCIVECGNGRLDANEECDDGNSSDSDGCLNSCIIRLGGVPETAASSCLEILTNQPESEDGRYWIDTNGGDTSDAFEAFCFMTSPSGTPDYQLITPDQFYHADQNQKYGPTNGVNVFDYNCDGCSAAFRDYDYFCPNDKWEIFTYALRSHCDHSSHTSDEVFTSSLISNNGIQGVRFNQRNDNCGDPNEMTIMAACRLVGTSAPDPDIWNSAFRNVSWSN